ncbi:putative multiple-sugar transport system permease YteP [Paenibacillus allorhizoplanae]|uniref:Multiple-sugar transport system permease YteP n=1 Tax=Paenibacillus allorhizoplanae TaxID=2905648 RepID=A0ABM9CUV3_9BACL|nr:putative multiple-sugar transport system permease YteP [Paenibacillus allorhizoplanae]
MTARSQAIEKPGWSDIPTDKKALWLQRKKRFNQNKPLLLMFIPIAVYFILFKYIPMFGLVIAFKDYNFADGIWGSPWVGLENYSYLFTNPQMTQIIRNTIMLSALTVLVGFPFPIILAILLNEVRKMWFKKSVQTLVYLPYFLNWIIVGGLVTMIFAQQSGIVNILIKKTTGEAYPFLFKEFSWIAIFVGSSIWKNAGWSAIIYLAALTGIDPSLYEAASMDGANKWRKIWHITLPGIRSTIVLMFILSIGHVMDIGFDQVYILQNPVVKNISEVISTWNYKVGLGSGEYSHGAALGLFESIIGLTMVLTANGIAKKFNQGLW